jgi:hypothetical protein
MLSSSFWFSAHHPGYVKNALSEKPWKPRRKRIRYGADEGIRTPGLRITNALLYQLSYISKYFIRILIFNSKVNWDIYTFV